MHPHLKRIGRLIYTDGKKKEPCMVFGHVHLFLTPPGASAPECAAWGAGTFLEKILTNLLTPSSGHASSCCVTKHLTVLQGVEVRRWFRLRQRLHIRTVAPTAAECGLMKRHVVLMNRSNTAQFHLCNTWQFGTQEISVAFVSEWPQLINTSFVKMASSSSSCWTSFVIFCFDAFPWKIFCWS